MGTGQFSMGPSLLLLLLFLLPGGTSMSAAEPQYVVLVPFLIHTGSSEQICVQLSHLNESVTLSVTLEYGVHHPSLIVETLKRSLISDVVSKEDLFRCIPFQLPRWDSSMDSEVFLTVEVTGATLHFRSRKRVLVRNPENLIFVQTDKPIYKAGQEVRFRIVSMDEDFRPLEEQFPLVYIVDPNGNRLLQWVDVQPKVGLVQLSFPLNSEPLLGTYNVVVQKASGRNVQQPFEVKEYGLKKQSNFLIPNDVQCDPNMEKHLPFNLEYAQQIMKANLLGIELSELPKFEVTVKTPKRITILAEELEVTVCGLYTSGRPVPGLVNVHVCRPYFLGFTDMRECMRKKSEAACEEFSGAADGHGCLSQVVKTKAFQLQRVGYPMKILVEGKISEEGTGVELTGTASTEITSTLSTVTFEGVDTFFKPGIPLYGQVKVEDGTNLPITNATVEIHVASFEAKYTTDSQGRAHFSVDTTNFTDDSVHLQAQYKQEEQCLDRNWVCPHHQDATHTARPFSSRSHTYLHIEPVYGTLSCSQTQPVRVHYILNPDIMSEMKLVFYYLVMAKGDIVQSGTHKLPLEHREAKGVFLLNLTLDIKTAPIARLILYMILPGGELVADSLEFNVENCLSNNVKLQFSDPEGLPSSKTHLHLSVSSPSLCAIHAVDKSVFLLKAKSELSPETVYNLLPVKTFRGYRYDRLVLDEPNIQPCYVGERIVVDSIMSYVLEPYKKIVGEAFLVFQAAGLKVFTNTKIRKCAENPYFPRKGTSSGHADYSGEKPADHQEAKQTHRDYFAETWIWDIVAVGEDSLADPSKQEAGAPVPPGHPPSSIDIPVTIPDTITEWRAGAFCLSPDAGFGLAQTVSLTASQPFSLELTLPYSMVLGEAFTLKATIFNYLQRCIQVRISLASSLEFEASPVEKEEDSYCLCAYKRRTVSWVVTPKSLGEVNFTASAEALKSDQLCGDEIVEVPSHGQKQTVVQWLLVEPEGVERNVVFSNLLCAAAERSSSVSLTLPGDVVEGSARASFCVQGDLLGAAIENLHQLLQMPYGCGEPNMSLFAPNIYILDYLNRTGQLTEAIKSKATGYLMAGYQRQLKYKWHDGSYSIFEKQSRRPGNTWLTAFVLKSFAHARGYIFVEEKHIQRAQDALAKRQEGNGCFPGREGFYNYALKGGVDDVTLTAYVTIALLEIPLPVEHSMVHKALLCLETAAVRVAEGPVYPWALLAYAFTLAGREEQRQAMLQRLEKEAVKEEDGSLHWQRPGKQAEEGGLLSHRSPRAASAEVEMTAYVLLAYLSKRPAPSQEELATATRIVQWLSRQQNPTGGFSSTQDTVVALQALSLFGTLTYTQRGAGTEVTLSSGGEVLGQFQVGSANRLLPQYQALPKVPGDYDTKAMGEGCVYAQTILKYNVPLGREVAPFSLEVRTDPASCAGPQAHKSFQVTVNVSYVGKRPASDMTIVDMKMLSGFIPLKSSVKKLELQDRTVKRTEVSKTRVLIYLEEVNSLTQRYSVTVEQEVPVQGLKPALVTVYDYYETDERAAVEYRAPCSTAGTKQRHA